MGGIGNELLLLIPGDFHRSDGPTGQEDAQKQEGSKCYETNENTIQKQIPKSSLLTADIYEAVAASRRIDPQKTERFTPQDAVFRALALCCRQ